VFAHAQRLPPDFFDRRHLGDMMVRLTGDVAVIEGSPPLACSAWRPRR
jgi:ABC-type multidrug transport system fused ATPase/permease subunit